MPYLVYILFILQHIIVQNALGQELNFTVKKDISDNISIYFFSGPKFSNRTVIKLKDGLSLPESRNFDTTKQTMFHFPGWGSNATSGSSEALAKAFLKTKYANFVALEYSALTTAKGNPLNYIGSVYNASYIGQAIGEFLKSYIPEKQPLHLIRMVSHSLGSQIMAKAAVVFGTGKLPHITGLDPAGPLFYSPANKNLEKSDAQFVDVIHTDGGIAGDSRTIGTVDFLPNNGTQVQPGCGKDSWNIISNFLSANSCSHGRAYLYYAESVVNGTAFPAKLCKRTFPSGYCCCNDMIIAYMGYNVSTSANGTFYLKTNPKEPFGKGLAGINF